MLAVAVQEAEVERSLMQEREVAALEPQTTQQVVPVQPTLAEAVAGVDCQVLEETVVQAAPVL